MTTNPPPVEELLPCPFCASKGDVGKQLEGEWFVDCERTSACTGQVGPFKTEAEAIRAWNRRAA